jgi:hypothetical protein
MYYYDYEERATAKQEPFRFKTDFNRGCLLKNAEARDWIVTFLKKNNKNLGMCIHEFLFFYQTQIAFIFLNAVSKRIQASEKTNS